MPDRQQGLARAFLDSLKRTKRLLLEADAAARARKAAEAARNVRGHKAQRRRGDR